MRYILKFHTFAEEIQIREYMKRFILGVLIALVANNIHAQWSEEELVPYRQKAEKFAQKYVNQQINSKKWDRKYDAAVIEFAIDTMRIEKVIDFQNDDKHYSTYDMHQMNIFMKNEYDKLLNKYYSILMKQLPEEKKILLRNAQRLWISYRDSEQKLNSSLIGDKEGSMWGVIAGNMNYALTKDRVLHLFYLIQNVE